MVEGRVGITIGRQGRAHDIAGSSARVGLVWAGAVRGAGWVPGGGSVGNLYQSGTKTLRREARTPREASKFWTWNYKGIPVFCQTSSSLTTVCHSFLLSFL